VAGLTIAVALGAGGARGLAHIGVIRGLERLGLRPVGVAGGSIGALVGALYALGLGTDQLVDLHLGARVRAAIAPRLSRAGLLNPGPLVELVDSLIGGRSFADTTIPLAITAADLTGDERVVVRQGPIAPAVTASMMVPGVLPPICISGRWLSDPGVIDSVPVDVAAGFGAIAVVAVSADRDPSRRGRLLLTQPPISTFVRGAGQACEILGRQTHWPWPSHLGCALRRVSKGKQAYQAPPRIVAIQPAFGGMGANAFGASERAIELGEEAVQRAVPLLRAMSETL